MKCAIMQPYIFPYIGYFQLLDAVDTFIFYDDVNFINRGWVNRNNILMNGESKRFTLPLNKASQNKLINEITLAGPVNKIISTLNNAYKKAPYYHDVMPVINEVFSDASPTTLISDMAAASVKSISTYLGMEKTFIFSSKKYSDTRGMERAQRLIEICKRENCDRYVNAPGGKELYSKDMFAKQDIELEFILPSIKEYRQFNKEFIPGLSIIDVLMFNDIYTVKDLIKGYGLE